ncbi:hypothetical protein EON62_06515, partial [archaeon]
VRAPAPGAAIDLDAEEAESKEDLLLGPQQAAVFDLAVVAGKSIFFTGSAGTGKSFLLRHIITALKDRYLADGVSDAVFVCASTGIAAVNIGGTSVHNFAGLTPSSLPVEQQLARISQAAIKRWKQARVLVIDEVRSRLSRAGDAHWCDTLSKRTAMRLYSHGERCSLVPWTARCVRAVQISMLDAATFDLLDAAARRFRHTERPFGGIQLILAGDFFQLPPVGLGERPREIGSDYSGRGGHGAGARGRGGGTARGRGGSSGGGGQPSRPYAAGSGTVHGMPGADTLVRFCFEAEAWSRALDVQVTLTQVYRQNDPTFINILNELRVGTITSAGAAALRSSK